MKPLAAYALIGCLYAPLAWSQCSGVMIDGQCLPPPCTPGSPLPCPNQQQQPQEQMPVQPQAVWADRWGEIVIAEDTRDAGTASGRVSRSEAISASMGDCASHGAKRCKLELAYQINVRRWLVAPISMEPQERPPNHWQNRTP